MRRQSPQDGTGVIEDDGKNNITRVQANTTPTDGVAGYATGCEWFNRSGPAGSIYYINQGTITSATWINLA